MIAVATLLMFSNLEAQNYAVKQVLIGSGGNFSDPEDFVELSTYNPASNASWGFGSILTQSIQDMLIDGDVLYVAAQDSIAKFSLLTYNRLAITYAPGVNKLAVYENKLLATFAYPNTADFLRVYYADNLDFYTSIPQISDEAAGMLVVENKLFVAVPGGWMSTVGKIALIDLSEFLFLKEVSFGAQSAGIFNLYLNGEQIITVNKSAWGATSGYLTQVNQSLSQFTHTEIPYAIGAGVGMLNNSLFVQMNGGIGEVNLTDMTLVNESVVEPTDLTMAAAVLDTVNSLFYVTTTDYASVGEGFVFNMNGENIASFEAGIAPESVVIDYKISSDIGEHLSVVNIDASPNPAEDYCTLSFPKELTGAYWVVTDLQGRRILNGYVSANEQSVVLDLSSLQSGMYLATAQNRSYHAVVKILIK